MDGEGAAQIAAMAGLEVQRYATKPFRGGSGGLMDVDMELDRRVKTLFELIGYLASYIVDPADREALFRPSGLTTHLAGMA
ncbi:unnamed protein product, partial [Ectocarpus sp. 8 AP-2014]